MFAYLTRISLAKLRAIPCHFRFVVTAMEPVTGLATQVRVSFNLVNLADIKVSSLIFTDRMLKPRIDR